MQKQATKKTEFFFTKIPILLLQPFSIMDFHFLLFCFLSVFFAISTKNYYHITGGKELQKHTHKPIILLLLGLNFPFAAVEYCPLLYSHIFNFVLLVFFFFFFFCVRFDGLGLHNVNVTNGTEQYLGQNNFD